MFSFFSCKKFEEGTGFRRVCLEPVQGKYLFNNNKVTGVSYLINFDNLDKAYEVWNQIADSKMVDIIEEKLLEMKQIAEQAKQENLTARELELLNNRLNNLAEQVKAIYSESRRIEDGKIL